MLRGVGQRGSCGLDMSNRSKAFTFMFWQVLGWGTIRKISKRGGVSSEKNRIERREARGAIVLEWLSLADHNMQVCVCGR